MAPKEKYFVALSQVIRVVVLVIFVTISAGLFPIKARGSDKGADGCNPADWCRVYIRIRDF